MRVGAMFSLSQRLSRKTQSSHIAAESDNSQELGERIRSLIFFVLFYLYLWLYIDMRLLYEGGGVITNFPVFFRGWAFAREFLSQPGGPVEYLSAFLSQLFYYSWMGALVVTLQAWLIFVCMRYFLKAIDAPHLRCISFVPPILLLVVYGQYTYHFITTMALAVALLFACLYIRLTRCRAGPISDSSAESCPNKILCIIVFLVLSVVLYTMAAGAYLLFAVLCAIYELLVRRWWQLSVPYLLSAVIIPYVEGVLLFHVSITAAYSDLLPFSWKILGWPSRGELIIVVYAMFLLLPLTALTLGLWRLNIANSKQGTEDRKRKRALARYALSGKAKWVIESLLIFAVAGMTAFFSHSAERKTLHAVQYYACRRMWPEVLQAARRYPYSSLTINAVNRALYHTGRLGYDMFSYPQHPDALLLTAEDNIVAYWHKFDTQLDLGLVNMAQKNLIECMEVYGAHPTILKRLALINMVKANYDSAKIYLGALSKTLFDADWVNEYLAHLRSDPDLLKDDRIQRLRGLCLEKDHGSLLYAKQKALSALLEENSQNRMAFEYLMAWYMLTKQLDKLTQNIKHLNDFDYAEVPRLYEQAALIYAYGAKKTVHLDGRQANPDVRRQIEHFSKVYNRYNRNKQAAFADLAKDYGDSYFFYYIYGFSGMKQ
jgi:hypothetical protein